MCGRRFHLSLQRCTGVVLRRTLQRIPDRRSWFVGLSGGDAADAAERFSEQWPTDLVVGEHDCRHYTNGLVEVLTGEKRVLDSLRSAANEAAPWWMISQNGNCYQTVLQTRMEEMKILERIPWLELEAKVETLMYVIRWYFLNYKIWVQLVISSSYDILEKDNQQHGGKKHNDTHSTMWVMPIMFTK